MQNYSLILKIFDVIIYKRIINTRLSYGLRYNAEAYIHTRRTNMEVNMENMQSGVRLENFER